MNGKPGHERDSDRPAPDAVRQPDAGRGLAGDANTATEIPLSMRGRPAASAPPSTRAASDTTLPGLAWTLLERRWTVLAVTALAVALSVLSLVSTGPTYRASILVQVQGRSRPVTAFEDLATLFQENTPREGEMRIMASRVLLEGIAKRLQLDLDVRPRTFPVIGEVLARRYQGAAPAPARFGLARYAWGGERVDVERLTVSEALLGEPLTLAVLEGGRYRIATRDGTVLVEAAVGTPATGTDGERSVELLVSGITARGGTEFTVVKRHPLDVVEELQQTLVISERGRETGLVEVALSGPDPARIARILDALSASYVRQSVERTSAEAVKMLRALEGQVPHLQAGLEAAERAFKDFHLRNGTVNVSLEAQAMLARLAEIDRAIAEDDLNVASRYRYGAQYPETRPSKERAEQLRAQRAAVEARMRKLPELELQSVRLSRKMNAAADLYLLVLNRAEELRIVKSGWIGNVRVLEGAAVPHRPVGPKPTLVLALGAFLGLGAGIALALAKEALGRRAAHADDIEAGTGIPVLATIFHSAAQRRLARGARGRSATPLAIAKPADAAVEDLRDLRTSVQFALRHAQNRVVAISGLAPRAGKSFVSMNLAHLLAAAGERVVLVECDLRRGSLHQHFGAEGAPGLADLLNGPGLELEQALRATGTPGLDLLPGGTRPENPAELLAGDRFEQLLAELGRRYAVVIVDAPPVLAVSDSALVGRNAGVNLIVLRAGEHSVTEISHALRRLVRSGVTIAGAVLNDVRESRMRAARTDRYRMHYAEPARASPR